MSSFKPLKPPLVRHFSSPEYSRYRDRKQEEWSPRSEESDPSSDEENSVMNSKVVDSPFTEYSANGLPYPLRSNFTLASSSLSSSYGSEKGNSRLQEQSFSRSSSLVVGRRSRPVGLKDVDLAHNPRAQYIREAREASRSPKKGQVMSPISRQMSCPSIQSGGLSGKMCLTSDTGGRFSCIQPVVPKSGLSSTAFGKQMDLGWVHLYSTNNDSVQLLDNRHESVSACKMQDLVPLNNTVPLIDLTTDETLQDSEGKVDNEATLLKTSKDKDGVDCQTLAVQHCKPPWKGLDKTNVSSFSDDEDSDIGKHEKRKSIEQVPVEPTTNQVQESKHKDRHFMMSFMKTSCCLTLGILLLSMYLHVNPHGFCLDSEFIKNISGIEVAFQNELYGQHIAQKIVISALKNHLKKRNVKTPLVMSFHGWTGIGKNFVSKIIAEHLFKQKTLSPFVHKFIIPLHFPHAAEIDFYRKQLEEWIHGNVSKCTKGALFIFDEMDKIPTAMMDTIRDAILFQRWKPSREDYSNILFIFLSNSGGQAINQHLLRHCTKGQSRESVALSELESILHNLAEIRPDVWFSDLLKLDLIDYFVPFLPLERTHVKQCIRRDLIKKGYSVKEAVVLDIADQLDYFPKDLQFFSVSGCKKVSSRVDVVVG